MMGSVAGADSSGTNGGGQLQSSNGSTKNWLLTPAAVMHRRAASAASPTSTANLQHASSSSVTVLSNCSANLIPHEQPPVSNNSSQQQQVRLRDEEGHVYYLNPTTGVATKDCSPAAGNALLQSIISGNTGGDAFRLPKQQNEPKNQHDQVAPTASSSAGYDTGPMVLAAYSVGNYHRSIHYVNNNIPQLYDGEEGYDEEDDQRWVEEETAASATGSTPSTANVPPSETSSNVSRSSGAAAIAGSISSSSGYGTTTVNGSCNNNNASPSRSINSSSLSLNTTLIEPNVELAVKSARKIGGTLVSASKPVMKRVAVCKDWEEEMAKAGCVPKHIAMEEVQEDEWGCSLTELHAAVEALRDHVKLFTPSQLLEPTTLDDLRNKLFGFVCTRIEPINPKDVAGAFGDLTPQTDKLYYAFHGIIVRPDPALASTTAGDDEEDVAEVASTSASSSSVSRQQPPETLPARPEIDALWKYFTSLQSWSKAASESRFGKMKPQHAVRGNMVLFQPDPPHSSWLRGVIDSATNVHDDDNTLLMTINSIDTGHIFPNIVLTQCTWLVPDWLEQELPALAVRALVSTAVVNLHARVPIVLFDRNETIHTRMYLNYADEVIPPKQRREPMFAKQLYEQLAIWSCALRRRQCLRLHTIHLEFMFAAYHPPIDQQQQQKAAGSNCAVSWDDEGEIIWE